MKDLTKYGLPWLILCLILILSNTYDWNLGGRGVGLLIGLVSVYYFNLNNPHKAYRLAVILSLLVWLIAIQIRAEYYAEIGSWLPALAAAVLAFIYFQRYQSREDKHWVDILKLAGVIALLPATYFESELTVFIVTYLAFIYLLDRFIIRRQMNKTTQIVTFCLMGLISLSFMIFSFIKADEAEKEKIRAEIAQKQAIEERMRADSEAEKAMEAAAEARRQAELAAMTLEECMSKNK
ncbi:hypothetical protein [Ekhidna sp.]|uniref:hypothetical protein n=1 Tax=Ekhidna sp. TaxID=2608089 RepID=UPI003B506304